MVKINVAMAALKYSMLQYNIMAFNGVSKTTMCMGVNHNAYTIVYILPHHTTKITPHEIFYQILLPRLLALISL